MSLPRKMLRTIDVSSKNVVNYSVCYRSVHSVHYRLVHSEHYRSIICTLQVNTLYTTGQYTTVHYRSVRSVHKRSVQGTCIRWLSSNSRLQAATMSLLVSCSAEHTSSSVRRVMSISSVTCDKFISLFYTLIYKCF